MSRTTNYREAAISDAADTAREFLDQIVEQLIDDDEASDDLNNDYGSGDSYHHESHVDRSYDLTEAAELLEELHDFEETDSGLWDGQAPREAIATQAAYTYGAAVYSLFQNLISDINDAYGNLKDEELDEGKERCEERRERLEELEDEEELDENDQKELAGLTETAAFDSEDAVEERRKVAIEQMVEDTIKAFEK